MKGQLFFFTFSERLLPHCVIQLIHTPAFLTAHLDKMRLTDQNVKQVKQPTIVNFVFLCHLGVDSFEIC